MLSSTVIRESWDSRIGFILAAVGSAVGLGNVWRFPFQTGQEGGAAFLLVYIFFILLIGLPAMLVELTLGRRTQRNPVGALGEIGGPRWRYVGGLFVLVGFIILAYYSVIAGWVMRYFLGSFTGGYLNNPEAYFATISTGFDAALFHALFMMLVIVIVASGVRQGIELVVKGIVPGLVVLMIGLALYAATLPNVQDAYIYYLSPDFNVIFTQWRSIIPAAAGQAFFTLSLGMGALLTYASYIKEDRNLLEDSGAIIALDTGIAIIVGLVVFPILFATSIGAVAPGPGAIFIALAGAFSTISFGWVIGILFFGAFTLAALSSAISLLEVVVAYAIDEHGISRMHAAVIIGGGIFLLGLPVTIDLIIIELYDILAAEILLVTGGLAMMILAGWLAPEEAIEELSKGMPTLGRGGALWIWLVRVPVILALLIAFYLAIFGYIEFLQTDFLDFLESRGVYNSLPVIKWPSKHVFFCVF